MVHAHRTGPSTASSVGQPDQHSNALSDTGNGNALAQHAVVCAIGQIVPKKAYKLAVDRNRVRRLVRAHTLSVLREQAQLQTPALQDNPLNAQATIEQAATGQAVIGQAVLPNIELLFRIKSIDKKTRAAGYSQQANPHSQAFSQALRAGLQRAIAQISTATQPAATNVSAYTNARANSITSTITSANKH
jgi:Ribonuclease P